MTEPTSGQVNNEDDLRGVVETADRTITHLNRIKVVLLRLTGIIGQYHALADRYTGQMPDGYLLDCLPLLDKEAVIAEELSEAIGDMSDDTRMMAELMLRITRL